VEIESAGLFPSNITSYNIGFVRSESYRNDLLGRKKVPGKLFFGKLFLSNGRGDPAPTLTFSAYGAFGTISGFYILVKVGARSPRPLFVDVPSNTP
jgi:hypothetical protein